MSKIEFQSVDMIPRKCRSCGATIRWGKTTNGRKMPVDFEPVDGPDGKQWVPHFATCPDANRWRKDKQGGANDK